MGEWRKVVVCTQSVITSHCLSLLFVNKMLSHGHDCAGVLFFLDCSNTFQKLLLYYMKMMEYCVAVGLTEVRQAVAYDSES